MNNWIGCTLGAQTIFELVKSLHIIQLIVRNKITFNIILPSWIGFIKFYYNTDLRWPKSRQFDSYFGNNNLISIFIQIKKDTKKRIKKRIKRKFINSTCGIYFATTLSFSLLPFSSSRIFDISAQTYTLLSL